MTLILHPFSDTRPAEQIETLAIIKKLSKRYPIKSQLCNPTDDYWKFLLKNWNKDDLIIIEQDIVPTVDMIEELEECIEELCCFPYRLRDGRWSVWNNNIPVDQRDNTANAEYYVEPYDDLPEYAPASAFGCTKIVRSIQKQIPLQLYPVEKYAWWYLDSWISERVAHQLSNKRFHLHKPPVKHNHVYEMTIEVDGKMTTLTEDMPWLHVKL